MAANCKYCDEPTEHPGYGPVYDDFSEGYCSLSCEEDHKIERSQIFDPQVIKDAINPNLPLCDGCDSEEVLAVKRKDIQYAVMKCLICRHQRQLTADEYTTAWPDSDALPLTNNILERERQRIPQ